ncbi:MAG TPA: thioredoxin-like domain-containing protein [Isosphaeraceae bacterium]|jgi:hypothetical protein|nr:thioredoxin-like domain-containing protein [Isosphaeraceae bacterium]
MRQWRTNWAASLVVGAVAAAAGPAASGQQATPGVILENFRPTQRGVEYDSPAGKDAVDACKVERITNAKGEGIGFALRDGQGQLLRRFLDTNGTRDKEKHTHLDQWSYYKDGFEVYREVDLDEDGSPDECRWLNAGGTRVAEVKRGHIVAWKRLSAEEAAKVVVQAIATKDPELLETVLATPEEIQRLGLPRTVVDQAGAKADRPKQLDDLRATLLKNGWDKRTVLTLFDGKLPHAIPADPALGLKQDLLLYENAILLAGPPTPAGANAAQVAYLNATDLVQLGTVWKFVGLPTAIDPSNPAPVVARDGLRAALFRVQPAGNDRPAADPALDKALAALAEHDKQGVPDPAAQPNGFLNFQRHRSELLGKVVPLVKNAAEKLAYEKQRIDCVVAMYQTGQYPAGRRVLENLIKAGGKLGAYTALRKLSADNDIAANQPGANLMKLQDQFIKSLEAFLVEYKGSDEEPDALYQLAVLREFSGDEKEAREAYQRLARDHAATEPGKKAVGALRRLDLVGKPLELKGEGPAGPVDAARFRGKTLLVIFWNVANDAGRHDLAELVKAYDKHKDQNFQVLAVNLDTDAAARDQYLKANPLPWPQVFDPKGMDGPLANDFGIISPPTMLLVGPDGKVVNRNLRSVTEVEKALDRPPAVASDAEK